MPVRKGNKKTGASKLKKKGKASEPAGKKTLGQESASSSGQEVKEEPAPQAAPSKPVTNETTAVDLQGAMKKKQKLSEELKAVEKQIYDLESRYLENSHALGSAIKGYEGLLSQNQASTRRMLVRQEDRLFSNSSLSGIPS